MLRGPRANEKGRHLPSFPPTYLAALSSVWRGRRLGFSAMFDIKENAPFPDEMAGKHFAKCRLFIGALVRGNNQLRYGHNLWGHSLYVPVSEIQTRGPQWMR